MIMISSTRTVSRGDNLACNAGRIYLENTQYHTTRGQCFPPCTGSDSAGLMHVEDQGLRGDLI